MSRYSEDLNEEMEKAGVYLDVHTFQYMVIRVLYLIACILMEK